VPEYSVGLNKKSWFEFWEESSQIGGFFDNMKRNAFFNISVKHFSFSTAISFENARNIGNH